MSYSFQRISLACATLYACIIGAAAVAGTYQTLAEQAADCLEEPSSAAYNSDICISFRNGYRYAEQGEGGEIYLRGGTVTQYSDTGEPIQRTYMDQEEYFRLLDQSQTSFSANLREILPNIIASKDMGSVVVVEPILPSAITLPYPQQPAGELEILR